MAAPLFRMQDDLLLKQIVIAMLTQQEGIAREYGRNQVANWRANHHQQWRSTANAYQNKRYRSKVEAEGRELRVLRPRGSVSEEQKRAEATEAMMEWRKKNHATYRPAANAYQNARNRRIAAAEGRIMRRTPRPAGTVSAEQRAVERKVIEARFKQNSPEKYKAAQRRYYHSHREKRRAYETHKRRTDPQKNLERKIRRRIWDAFSKARCGKRSEYKTIDLLGCSFAELRDYIGKLLQPGMTWNDVLTSRIHLDHIKPVSRFDLTDPLQVAACFRFSNLQPLWKADNLAKGDKLDYVVPQLK